MSDSRAEETASKSLTNGGKRRRRFRRRILAAAISTMTAFVILEAAVRMLGLAPRLPVQYQDFIADPVLAFRKRPDTVREGTSKSGEFSFTYRTNNAGFRDVPHAIKKPANTFRIFAVGDSFTWGVGAEFEDTFLARLERTLNGRGPNHPTVEIIKAGQPRYFPLMERLLLEHYGFQYEPDLVLALVVHNDLLDTIRGPNALKPSNREGFLLSQRSERIGALGTWLYIHCHVARALLAHFIPLDHLDERHDSARRIKLTRENTETAYRMVMGELARMQQLATEHGARFAVGYIPQKGLGTKTPARLAELLADRVDAFIDVQPNLYDAAVHRRERLYWTIDGHCTPIGYNVIAQALHEALTSLKLVP